MANGLTRLTEPMIREDGALRVATWDEALDRAAQGLRRATEPNGGNGVVISAQSTMVTEY